MGVTNHTENGLQAPYRMEGILCYCANPSEAPLSARGSKSRKKEAPLSESLLFVDSTCFGQLALEQANEGLLARIRLCEHRRSSLLEDLKAGQLTAFGSDIDIDNTAVSGFEVDGVSIQEVLSEIDTTHFRAVLGTHVGKLLKSFLREKCIFIRIV